VQIRTVRKEDYSAISDLILTAFSKSSNGYGGEAELVEKIRLDPTYHKTLEVVADQSGQIIGHGLLSEVQVKNANQSKTGLCLAPLEVSPSFQKQGIGQAILAELEQRAKRAKYNFISILGWPDYYSRFGYKKASLFNIKAPFPAPVDAYMIKALVPKGLEGVTGTVNYLSAFNI
jgi:predicted N-acetyltransferase YhbS